MRIMLVTAPFVGHTFPLVPLAWELRAAGHEVLLATAGQGVRAAESGLPVADIARRFDMRRTLRRFAVRNPLLARSERIGRAGTRALVMLFGEINDELADGAAALGDQWHPDLVLHGALAPAGAVVAARREVPAVLCDHTLFDGQQLSFATSALLSYAGGRHGVATPGPPAAVVRMAPPSVVGERPGWRMRYVPYDDGWVSPEWLDQAHPPRIAVVHRTAVGADDNLMRAAIRAAPHLAAEIVLVHPSLSAGASLPDNVRAAEWTSLHRLLPTCAGVVHRGGTDTVLTALAYGVPQLVVPDAGERRHNAGLVHKRGAGLVGARRNVAASMLRRLIDDDGLAGAAHEVRMEVSSAPDPAEIATKLADLS